MIFKHEIEKINYHLKKDGFGYVFNKVKTIFKHKLKMTMFYLKTEGLGFVLNKIKSLIFQSSLKGHKQYDENKESIIFVSHESSATGAPLLGYAIADKLIQKYNIIHLIIRKSNIHEKFLENCDVMYYGLEGRTYKKADSVIKKILKTRDIKCVVCNSVVTSEVVLAANLLELPTLLLIHEFNDYIKPLGRTMNAVINADKVVVPAKIVLDSIQEGLIRHSNNKIRPSNIEIIPQGKLPVISESYGDDDSADKLYKKLNIKPNEDVKIVVGSGWVDIRKGVDLFISTAAQIKDNYNGKCKFVWVGGGFLPEIDSAYSMWLQRDIKAFGLEDDFIFLQHQKSLDTIFSISDVFALTSRMDPFPNVVVEALSHNLHVACFENTSGSSEFLLKHNADATVVDYLDTYKLAKGIVEYFESSKTKSDINKKIVEKYLDFDSYVDKLDELITESVKFKNKSAQIVSQILKSDEFDAKFFGGEGDINRRCKTYVNTSLKGILLQNPKPGFSQLKWIEENSKYNPYVVPLYEAIKLGKTNTHDVEIVPNKITAKIEYFYAVHLHLFYVELADEFAKYFQMLPGKFDILITVVNKEDIEPAKEAFAICGANEVKVTLVENIGRDSGPLIFGLRDEILKSNYEVIGHFHSKKSFQAHDGIGDRWRKYLLQNLLGDESVSLSILNLFNDSKVGLVFPDDNHLVDIGENKEYISNLCDMLKIPTVEQTPFFPVGNMYWARVQAIKELFELTPDEILQEEPLPYDGSYMHAIERVTPNLVQHNGFIVKTVYKDGTKW